MVSSVSKNESVPGSVEEEPPKDKSLSCLWSLYMRCTTLRPHCKNFCDDDRPKRINLSPTGTAVQKKGLWRNNTEFLLNCIACSVGLGNIWRFPFKAYENGGGAFIFSYFILVFGVSIPLVIMELAMGQFSSRNAISVWDMVPMLRGIGLMQSCTAFVIVSYYCHIVGLGFYYLFQSMRATLPWAECQNDLESQPPNITCHQKDEIRAHATIPITPANQYFSYSVLQKLKDIDDGIEDPIIALVACLLLVYVLIFMVLWRGMVNSGKAAYFTASFPYIILSILFIVALGLDGAIDGIKIYLTPDWNQMTNLNVWYEAFKQVVYSVGNGIGVLIVFGSLNPFYHNTIRDGVVIALIDAFTSFFAGIVVFAFLGHVQYHHKVIRPLSSTKGVDEGIGLAFVVYPEAALTFESVPQLFSIVFFSMFIMLGLGSATGAVGSLVVTWEKEFCPQNKVAWTTLAILLAEFIVGVMYTTKGGIGILTLIDEFVSSAQLYGSAIECIGVAWAYGIGNFMLDLEFMHRDSMTVIWPALYWYLSLTMAFVVPILFITCAVYHLANYKIPLYDNITSKEFPDMAIAWGWTVFGTLLLCIPVTMVVELYKTRRGRMKNRCIAAWEPNQRWGPLRNDKREEWLRFRHRKLHPNSPTKILHFKSDTPREMPTTSLNQTRASGSFEEEEIYSGGKGASSYSSHSSKKTVRFTDDIESYSSPDDDNFQGNAASGAGSAARTSTKELYLSPSPQEPSSSNNGQEAMLIVVSSRSHAPASPLPSSGKHSVQSGHRSESLLAKEQLRSPTPDSNDSRRQSPAHNVGYQPPRSRPSSVRSRPSNARDRGSSRSVPRQSDPNAYRAQRPLSSSGLRQAIHRPRPPRSSRPRSILDPRPRIQSQRVPHKSPMTSQPPVRTQAQQQFVRPEGPQSTRPQLSPDDSARLSVQKNSIRSSTGSPESKHSSPIQLHDHKNVRKTSTALMSFNEQLRQKRRAALGRPWPERRLDPSQSPTSSIVNLKDHSHSVSIDRFYNLSDSEISDLSVTPAQNPRTWRENVEKLIEAPKDNFTGTSKESNRGATPTEQSPQQHNQPRSPHEETLNESLAAVPVRSHTTEMVDRRSHKSSRNSKP